MDVSLYPPYLPRLQASGDLVGIPASRRHFGLAFSCFTIEARGYSLFIGILRGMAYHM